MLNRLQMRCDYHTNGCTQNINLEGYDKHVKECEYEKVKCRYEKCGQSILKKDIKNHEEVTCEFREKLCTGQCGLSIPVSIFDTHDCVEELHRHAAGMESWNKVVMK